MEPWLRDNRALWDELVAINAAAPDFYDIEGFAKGASTLRPLEITEVGDVRGKSLLHLQCHFGLDTLSWARRGAQVVGVDFSSKSIALAEELSERTGVPGRFVCSNVYDLTDRLGGLFDVVFTSYGVLCWLPDLRGWAATIARFVKPGGFFYLVEQHPLGNMLVEQGGELLAQDPYFNVGAFVESGDGTYADPDAVLEHKTSHEWQHPLSEIVTAVVDAGLHLDFLHEFPFSPYRRLPSMQRGDDGWWRLPDRDDVPFVFSLRASRAPGD